MKMTRYCLLIFKVTTAAKTITLL